MPVWRKEHEFARVVVHFIGMIIFAIGLTAFSGHLSNNAPMISWGYVGAMAMPSAVVAMLSGVAFFLVSRGEASHGEAR
jgi:polyferredoxin